MFMVSVDTGGVVASWVILSGVSSVSGSDASRALRLLWVLLASGPVSSFQLVSLDTSHG